MSYVGLHYVSPNLRGIAIPLNDPTYDMAVKLNQKVKAKKGVWGSYGTKNFSLPKAIVHHGCQVVGEIVKVKDGGKTLIAVLYG